MAEGERAIFRLPDKRLGTSGLSGVHGVGGCAFDAADDRRDGVPGRDRDGQVDVIRHESEREDLCVNVAAGGANGDIDDGLDRGIDERLPIACRPNDVIGEAGVWHGADGT
ncbi:MAG TPA: hypothetical protein VFX03_04100 [Thermomicrobiales bacterium]|nr:hypothetical protein [Thermomicrobiales bacterium]